MSDAAIDPLEKRNVERPNRLQQPTFSALVDRYTIRAARTAAKTKIGRDYCGPPQACQCKALDIPVSWDAVLAPKYEEVNRVSASYVVS